MFKIFLPFLIFSSITFTYADSVTQTDWSGVPGVWGPVTSFNTDFYFDSGVACYSGSGDIALGMIDNVVPHNVAWNLNGPKSVYSEDIDGDGDMDIIGSVFSDNEVIWWENINGSGIEWNEHIIDDNFYHAEAICSKDIDGDGDMDVIGASHGDTDITWWENQDGTGTSWIVHAVDWSYDAAYDVHSEDIDGDGDMDVISASSVLHEVTWFENQDGTGTFWIKHTIDDSLLGHSVVYSEDIDGESSFDDFSIDTYDSYVVNNHPMQAYDLQTFSEDGDTWVFTSWRMSAQYHVEGPIGLTAHLDEDVECD